MGLIVEGISWDNLNKLKRVLKHLYAPKYLVTIIIRHDLSNVNIRYIRLER